MGKQLKKIEYGPEKEAHFRETLKTASIKAVKVKPTFTIDDLPKNCVEKIINDPSKFVSKLKSDDPTKCKIEFVKFVYGKYRVPQLLDKAWTVRHNNYYNDYRFHNQLQEYRTETLYDFNAWWVCVSTGGSLYKDQCKDFLTKKEVHTFLTCPHDITLQEAVIYSVAVCYGASVGEALRLSKSNLKDKNLAVGPNKIFWRDVIHFFSMNTPGSVKDINDLMDYLTHKRNENIAYTVLGQGFTLYSLNKKMKDWHYELARIKVMGGAAWEGHGIANSEFTVKDEFGKNIRWTMTQITSAKELAEEGNTMRHCVYGYKEECKAGYCSIWSLKSCGESGQVMKRRITIELNNRGEIVQARGLANRKPKADEMNIITKWCCKENLHYSGW
jgi:hypothetical protein